MSSGSSVESGGGVFDYGKDSTLLACNVYVIHCIVYKESNHIIHQSSVKNLGLELSC